MREIKFRVWDKKSHKMFPVADIYNVGSTGIRGCTVKIIGRALMDSNSHAIPTDILVKSRAVLMQYTGLTDKKNRDIYEGDILCYAGGKSEGYRGVVEFGKDTPTYWKSGASWPSFHVHGLVWKPEACEVIGNIYENPELIKENN